MAATKPPAAALHFVVSTDVEKPSPALRTFIRRQCMLGKNQGKALAPRKRKPTNTQDPPAPSTTTTLSRHVLHATVPRKFGSDLSTIRFADAVEPSEAEDLLQLLSITKQVHPVQPSALFDRRVEAWIAPLALDPVYLHAMIFTSQYYCDAMLPRTARPGNQRSLSQSVVVIKLLRERLTHDDDQARLSFTTAAAVMILASYALWNGNSDIARHHMEGLKTIVGLRGGVATFTENPQLLIEVLRCDLGTALYSGFKPLFFDKSSSQKPYPPYPNLKWLLYLRSPAVTGSHNQSARFLNDMANELAVIWEIMWEFCSLINFAGFGQCVSVETLLETIALVMYRLIALKFDAGSSDEAIRLGLLAFSCTAFLQWQRLGMSYPPLTTAFRNSLTTMNSQQMSRHLVLWLFMVGAALVFNATENWWIKPALRAKLDLCGIRSWGEMRYLLKSCMWIDLIHDKPGRRVFDSTTADRHCPALDVAHRSIVTSSRQGDDRNKLAGFSD